MSNMKKKTVMKVGIKSPECKIDIMKAVAKLKGVEQVKLDSEKQLLTVIGEVNPCLIAKKVQKAGKTVDLLEVKTARTVQELNRLRGDYSDWNYYRYNNNSYDSSYYECSPRTTYDCPPRITYDCPPRGIRQPPQYYKEYVVCNDSPGDCSIL